MLAGKKLLCYERRGLILLFDEMPESENNAWLHTEQHGFNRSRFPSGMDCVEGLLPIPVVINLDVGQEVVLFLKDDAIYQHPG